jgi:hypothetical protein
MPDDRVKALELRTLTVKRVSRPRACRRRMSCPSPFPACLRHAPTTFPCSFHRYASHLLTCVRCFPQIMRAALRETVADSRSQDTILGRPAVRGPAHPHFVPLSSSASGRDGGAGSNAHGGKEPAATSAHGHSAGSQAEGHGDEDKTSLCIRDDACFVMARACELFAMDIAKRSELVLEDQIGR